MTKKWLTLLAAIVAMAAGSNTAMAKDVVDTLFSQAGDRIIIDYTIQQTGGQTSLRFNSVQKKLGTKNQKEYKKLDEVAVVIFDRTGSYNDMKFEGITPCTFMVPAGVQYSFSNDGYFLLQDNPQLTFTTSNEAQISIPVYLAHYEKKRHYKLFSQMEPLVFSTKVKGGGGGAKASKGGAAADDDDRAANADDIVTTTEELIDDGLSPVDEALIRVATVQSMLDKATKVPFSEELTHEAAMLRELRYKIADPEVGDQIAKVLEAYDTKKAELETQAEQNQQAAAAAQQAAAQQQAQQQQARQDSIQAAQAKQASDDKKDMMWLIGGIAGLGMLLMAGKQVFQTIKNNKMQKMMMDNIKKAQEQALGNVKIPGLDDNPLTKDVNAQLQREARKKMNADGDAAMEKLKGLGKGAGGDAAKKPAAQKAASAAPQANPAAQPSATAQQPAADGKPTTPGKRPLRTASEVKAAAGIASAGITVGGGKHQSLNDAIPAKYKRWRKPGSDNTTNNAK